MSVAGALQGLTICTAALVLILISGRVANYYLWRRRLHPKREAHKAEQCLDGDALVLIGIEVAARLRAGMPTKRAWQKAWERFSSSANMEFDEAGLPEPLLELAAQTRRELDRSAAEAMVGACRFSYYCGAPLADVLEQITQGISDNLTARRAQDRAFAGPKMSARILTALPIIAVLGGQALGAGSIYWLLTAGVGRVCLVVGLGLLAAGHGVSVRLIEAGRLKAKDQLLATTLCDLARAGLTAGVPIPTVLSILGQTGGVESLETTSKTLLLGASWEDAWDPGDARTELLSSALQPCWEDGVSPTNLLRVSVEQSRSRHLASVEEDAAKLEVKLVFPLGLLLLPSFIALGIIPIIFALINGQLTL